LLRPAQADDGDPIGRELAIGVNDRDLAGLALDLSRLDQPLKHPVQLAVDRGCRPGQSAALRDSHHHCVPTILHGRLSRDLDLHGIILPPGAFPLSRHARLFRSTVF
jgi:hypothetical protein